MKKRGRKSAGELATLMPSASRMYRPDAPYDLTDEQADEWRAVVNRMPADWFPRETHGVLAQYCRHVVRARRVAQLLEQMERAKGALDLEEYDRLGKMADRESRALSSLATRMRLTQQATLDRTKSKGKGTGGEKPWNKAFDLSPAQDPKRR